MADFSKLNGYIVKDKKAREDIGELENLNTVEKNNLVGAINEHGTKIDTHENRLNINENEQVIFLGDSYGAYTNSWADELANIMGLTLGTNAFNFCTGNAGFLVENNTYLDNLQNNESVILNKNNIKKVIVCGGFNDRIASNINVFDTPMNNLITYIKNNYPNAIIYVGMIGFTNAFNDTQGNIHVRDWLKNIVLRGYKDNALKYGAKYLSNVELILHDYSLFGDDGVHPNANGSLELAKGIFNAINGYYAPQKNYSEGISYGTGTLYINLYEHDGKLSTYVNGTLNLTSYLLFSNGYAEVDLGEYNGNRLRNIDYQSRIPIEGTIKILNTNEIRNFKGYLTCNSEGHCIAHITPYVYTDSLYATVLTFSQHAPRTISSLMI